MIIKNLTKKFDGKIIFENFNVEFQEGKISCIVGESGEGKTTLLNCIAGISDFEGEIEKVGKVAYVFQDDRLIPFMTVKENLTFVSDKSEDEIRRILDFCNLAEKENAACKDLSGGEKQRVNVARAWLCDADVYLLDEPFSSVNRELKYKMADGFLNEKAGKTIIYVTHDLFEAAYVSDEIFSLKGKSITRYTNVLKKGERKPYSDESAKFISEIFG